MSDAVDYFKEHAVSALLKARRMPLGTRRNRQRAVGRVYHQLAREAARGFKSEHLEDFRDARMHEAQILRKLI